MKKVLLFAVLCFFVAGMSPVSATLETEFGGEFYVEGILNSNQNMLESDNTVDYRQMRLRVQTTFKVSDNLSLITRFDALEKILSSEDSAFDNNEDDDNIDFDRAYLAYISPIGLFEVGRMKGVTWGTSFADDEDDTDRIKYTVPIEVGDGKIYLFGVAEKVSEFDPMIDDDNDKFYIGGVFKNETITAGFISSLYSYNKFPDPGQRFAIDDLQASYDSNINNAAYRKFLADNGAQDGMASYGGWYSANATNALTAQGAQKMAIAAQAAGDLAKAGQYAAAAKAASEKIEADWLKANDMATSSLMTMKERGMFSDGKVYMFSPFFQGKFGDLRLEAELDYITGTLEYDDRYKAVERDVEGFAYYVEGGYDLSPISVQAGFAHSSGDANYEDTDVEAMGYVAPGVDWGKVFILNSDSHGMNGTLAGVGNHVGTGFATASTAMIDGYQMFYAGLDYAITDDITLGFIGAISKADDVPLGPGYDDDQGIEYDLTFTWNITDNLTYKAIGAYLDGGDYWTTRASGGTVNPAIDPEIYALFHRLTLTF
ncbi:MAG: hypothetical protein HQK67_06655 [Desulfamplus sp.]|nr:hypothetical protein [Desulfamplus sp.]